VKQINSSVGLSKAKIFYPQNPSERGVIFLINNCSGISTEL